MTLYVRTYLQLRRFLTLQLWIEGAPHGVDLALDFDLASGADVALFIVERIESPLATGASLDVLLSQPNGEIRLKCERVGPDLAPPFVDQPALPATGPELFRPLAAVAEEVAHETAVDLATRPDHLPAVGASQLFGQHLPDGTVR